MKKLLAVLLCAVLLCSITPSAFADPVSVEPLDIKNDNFIKGMDVSSVISLEESGVRFYSADGKESDLLKLLADNGVNYIRVRVWNSPFDSEGNGYGGGNSDVDKAAEIGRRAAENGMRLLVDFHYSDFWADPAKQKAPKQWQSLSADEKAVRLNEFTAEALQKIKKAGADIGMVQLGNETNGAIAGENEPEKMARLFNAGAKAVRDFDKSVQIAVHFTNPEKSGLIKYFADFLNENNVDYDVFAVSYYPYWHGSLSNLTEVLSYPAEKYGKLAMVAETSYANTLNDTDGHPNTVAKNSNDKGENLLWSFSEQGQADEVRAVMDAVNKIPNGRGLGVFYWEGAWISVGDTTGLSGTEYEKRLSENKSLWKKFGSGWASEASAEFDPDDAGKYYGGSAVDNQAFFDAGGKALSSLSVFGEVDRFTRGDASGDGKVNVLDATIIMKHLVKLTNLTGTRKKAADSDCNGKITIEDATLIQRVAAELEQFEQV